MKRKKLTILTDPIPYGRNFISETAKSLARAIRDRVSPNPANYNRSEYRGHPAVTRSLIEGLKKINASFNYNPKHPKEFADSVIVLSGVETLKQAIFLKRKGLIKTLYAGPNIVIFASDYDSIIASPEIDFVVTPCDLVIALYVQDSPNLKARCLAWPAGVDTQYWRPLPTIEREKILVFEKQNQESVGPVQPYVSYMQQRGYDVVVIKYGSFNHPQYLAYLQQSCLMLGFSTSESQGIAWAEAWSVDVPTLVWKNTTNVSQGRSYRCSTAPYLCAQNGLFFEDLNDFKSKFAYWELNRDDFRPRAWTLENMSDEICASNLYERVTAC